MARWQMPDLPEGPLRTFKHELHALHGKAGYPSARNLYLDVGKVVSHTKIHHAFIKPLLPSWGVVEVVVEQLAVQARPRLDADTEVGRFKELWDKAHDSHTPMVSIPAPRAGEQVDGPAVGYIPQSFRAKPVVAANNGLIWQVLVDLHKAGMPTSVPHVAAELERRGQLELCGGEEYLYECLRAAMKGAYEAGLSIPEFALLNARKVRDSAVARRERLASLLDPSSEAYRGRGEHERVPELHPHRIHPQQT
ncbi:DnaB-like helicase N-terminal domain-containing protein [Streptomyces sp. NPDC055912]|uniref:DnaB-like helicase N-terminal domain-containing protein n=1 Tax=unclassified Streptomyces TaxID=2593676 RepID=UPI0035E224D7